MAPGMPAKAQGEGHGSRTGEDGATARDLIVGKDFHLSLQLGKTIQNFPGQFTHFTDRAHDPRVPNGTLARNLYKSLQ